MDGWMSEGMRRRRRRQRPPRVTPQSNAALNHRIPLGRRPSKTLSTEGGRGEQVVLLMSQILMGRKETISNKGALTSQERRAVVTGVSNAKYELFIQKRYIQLSMNY